MNDFWCLNVEKGPFSWQKFESKSEAPIARVYHSAALCQHGSATGMIVVFGGRSGQQVALNDSWGLRRHRSGAWDWVKAPYKPDKEPPLARYQHSSLFVGSTMLILGGRTNEPGNVGMEIYDTETSEWYRAPAAQTFRHGSWFSEGFIYLYGGFDQEAPNIPTDLVTRINILKAFQVHEPLYIKTQALVGSVIPKQSSTLTSPNTSIDMGNKSTGAHSAYSYSPNTSYSDLRAGGGSYAGTTMKPGMILESYSNSPLMRFGGEFKFGKDVYVALNDQSRPNEELVKRTIPFEKFTEESKGLGGHSNKLKYSNPMSSNMTPALNIASIFLNKLLRPRDYFNPDLNAAFEFKPELIIELCNHAEAILQSQPIVLRVNSPIKVFGDIHGQYSDLMRFFDLFGSPCYGANTEGDIESFDYLFLGDFVDRGSHSLETICLLLALKIKYPTQIHLIRGNHEDRWINNGFGFSEECATRLGEDPADEDSIFNRMNCLFDWLPLAGVIDDRILCIHGGIGSTLNKVEDIDRLQRPLEVIHEVSTADQQLVVDILWSDPTDSDTEMGIQANTIRDPGGTGNIVKFGPDRVQRFLQNNGLSLIIRAHECVMDGFERFAGGQLITVFSATDYCGKHKNAGAVLTFKKTLEIIPKLIYPMNANNQNWIEDEKSLKERPPTPPRWKNTAPRKSSYG